MKRVAALALTLASLAAYPAGPKPELWVMRMHMLAKLTDEDVAALRVKARDQARKNREDCQREMTRTGATICSQPVGSGNTEFVFETLLLGACAFVKDEAQARRARCLP